MSKPLPKEFKYDAAHQTVDVEYGDGSIVRYFGIHPNLAFLSPTNPHRNRDFIDFLWRFRPVKSEIIQDPTNEPGEPECFNAVRINKEQNGVTKENSSAPWLSRWGHKPYRPGRS